MIQILEFCIEAKTFQEILDFTGLKDRVSFKRTYIEPLIMSGKLSMTEPENPTSRRQQYVAVKRDI